MTEASWNLLYHRVGTLLYEREAAVDQGFWRMHTYQPLKFPF